MDLHSNAKVLTPAIPERVSIIDALRGFALMGLFIIHCIEYFELYWMEASPSMVHNVVFFLFGGKSYAIFAMLFGLSFFIIMDRQKAKGVDFRLRFLWRLVVLFLLGFLHSLIYSGDILQVLAILGMILLLLDRFNNRSLFILSIVFLTNIPLIWHFVAARLNLPGANEMPVHWALSGINFEVWAHGSFVEVAKTNCTTGNMSKWYFFYESGRIFQMFGLFIWGILLGRINFFSQIQKFSKQCRTILIAASVAGSFLFALQLYLNHLSYTAFQEEGFAKWHLAQLVDSYLSLCIMLILILSFIKIYQHAKGYKILHFLVPAGRMSLTIYVTESLVGVPIFYGYGLGWYQTAGQVNSLIFGIIFFTLLLLFAHWWMKRFYYGPFEWLWRSATYMTIKVPLIRKN